MSSKCCLILFFACICWVNSARVAFRLDDIQDFWIRDPQQAVINKFRELGVPISIGIIGSFFGDDRLQVDYIEDILSDPNFEVEICSHGWLHEDFSNAGSVEDQEDLLRRTDERINSVLGVSPVQVFIPPFNAFNENTLQALRNRGYTHISSQIGTDTNPSMGESMEEGLPFYRVPIGASTSDYLGAQYFQPVPYTRTLSQIRNQINNLGYSAVMMHPQEFSVGAPSNFQNIVNEEQIAQLDALLRALIEDPDIELVPLGRLQGDQTVVTTSPNPDNPPALYRINCGGNSVGEYEADSYYYGSTLTATHGPLQQGEIYDSERYDPFGGPEMYYSFQVPNGAYRVVLHFAEIYEGTYGEGLRVFDVMIEGILVLRNFDVYREAGGANRGIRRELSVAVRDEKIDIVFIHKIENPKISAIEIYSEDASSPTGRRSLSLNSKTIGKTISCTNIKKGCLNLARFPPFVKKHQTFINVTVQFKHAGDSTDLVVRLLGDRGTTSWPSFGEHTITLQEIEGELEIQLSFNLSLALPNERLVLHSFLVPSGQKENDRTTQTLEYISLLSQNNSGHFLLG